MKKNYCGIDIMKFLASILVIYMHTSPLIEVNNNLDYIIFSISRSAVPFFLVTSGYLFFKKVTKEEANTQILTKYLKRLFTLYLSWSILMLPLSIWNLRRLGIAKGILNYLRDFAFVGSYAQLWYFPALMLGIFLVFYFYKRTSIKNIVVLSTIIFFIGLLGNSYNIFIHNNIAIQTFWDKYYSVFTTTRNGLFYAFLFVSLGLLLSKYKLKISNAKNIVLLVISFILLIIESFILRNNGAPRNFDMCIMLIPVSILLVNLLINVTISEKPIYIFFRNSSVLIFGIHFILIQIFSKVLNLIGVVYMKSLITFILTTVFSIIFSIIILSMEKYIKILKYLH